MVENICKSYFRNKKQRKLLTLRSTISNLRKYCLYTSRELCYGSYIKTFVLFQNSETTKHQNFYSCDNFATETHALHNTSIYILAQATSLLNCMFFYFLKLFKGLHKQIPLLKSRKIIGPLSHTIDNLLIDSWRYIADFNVSVIFITFRSSQGCFYWSYEDRSSDYHTGGKNSNLWKTRSL